MDGADRRAAHAEAQPPQPLANFRRAPSLESLASTRRSGPRAPAAAGWRGGTADGCDPSGLAGPNACTARRSCSPSSGRCRIRHRGWTWRGPPSGGPQTADVRPPRDTPSTACPLLLRGRVSPMSPVYGVTYLSGRTGRERRAEAQVVLLLTGRHLNHATSEQPIEPRPRPEVIPKALR